MRKPEIGDSVQLSEVGSRDPALEPSVLPSGAETRTEDDGSYRDVQCGYHHWYFSNLNDRMGRNIFSLKT